MLCVIHTTIKGTIVTKNTEIDFQKDLDVALEQLNLATSVERRAITAVASARSGGNVANLSAAVESLFQTAGLRGSITPSVESLQEAADRASDIVGKLVRTILRMVDRLIEKMTAVPPKLEEIAKSVIQYVTEMQDAEMGYAISLNGPAAGKVFNETSASELVSTFVRFTDTIGDVGSITAALAYDIKKTQNSSEIGHTVEDLEGILKRGVSAVDGTFLGKQKLTITVTKHDANVKITPYVESTESAQGKHLEIHHEHLKGMAQALETAASRIRKGAESLASVRSELARVEDVKLSKAAKEDEKEHAAHCFMLIGQYLKLVNIVEQRAAAMGEATHFILTKVKGTPSTESFENDEDHQAAVDAIDSLDSIPEVVDTTDIVSETVTQVQPYVQTEEGRADQPLAIALEGLLRAAGAPGLAARAVQGKTVSTEGFKETVTALGKSIANLIKRLYEFVRNGVQALLRLRQKTSKDYSEAVSAFKKVASLASSGKASSKQILDILNSVEAPGHAYTLNLEAFKSSGKEAVQWGVKATRALTDCVKVAGKALNDGPASIIKNFSVASARSGGSSPYYETATWSSMDLLIHTWKFSKPGVRFSAFAEASNKYRPEETASFSAGFKYEAKEEGGDEVTPLAATINAVIPVLEAYEYSFGLTEGDYSRLNEFAGRIPKIDDATVEIQKIGIRTLSGYISRCLAAAHAIENIRRRALVTALMISRKAASTKGGQLRLTAA